MQGLLTISNDHTGRDHRLYQLTVTSRHEQLTVPLMVSPSPPDSMGTTHLLVVSEKQKLKI